MLDSPCVTFNNNPKSTKGYDHVRDHLEATRTVDYLTFKYEISAEYEQSQSKEVTVYYGSVLHLHKADPELNLTRRRSALRLIKAYKAKDQILTGLLFMNEDTQPLHEILGTNKTPLRDLGAAECLRDRKC
jgi:2-oxoglutarate ferredoxin oxidoreductase subunit beta